MIENLTVADEKKNRSIQQITIFIEQAEQRRALGNGIIKDQAIKNDNYLIERIKDGLFMAYSRGVELSDPILKWTNDHNIPTVSTESFINCLKVQRHRLRSIQRLDRAALDDFLYDLHKALYLIVQKP